MKYEDVMVRFKRILADRFPGKYRYVSVMADILGIHPKTVRRKLNGVSEFTFYEMVKIAQVLDISLESVFTADGNALKHPMELYLQDFSEPTLAQQVIHDTLAGFRLAAGSGMSTHMVATNTIPQVVSLRYKWIARFMYLKWYYYNRKSKGMVPFAKVDLSEEFKAMYREYWDTVGQMKRSIYVFTADMMRHVLGNVSFFYDRGYITDSEVLYLIGDYRTMLEEQEELCACGFTSGGKEVNIFYSTVLLHNDMVVMDSDNIRFAIVYAYGFNPIVTKNVSTFEAVREWFYTLVSSSCLISLSGEPERYKFFQRQRAELDKMENAIKNG